MIRNNGELSNWFDKLEFFFFFPFIEKLCPPVCSTVPNSLQAQSHRAKDCNKGLGRAIREGDFAILGKTLSLSVSLCLSPSLSLSHCFFPSFEGNGFIKSCQLALERGKKLIRVTQKCFNNSFLLSLFSHHITFNGFASYLKLIRKSM